MLPSPTSKFELPLSAKQKRLVKLCHRQPGAKKFILASGPRMATKSTACWQAIADHLWEVPNAQFAVISPTVTSADDAGCWTEITEHVLPYWINGNFGMEWIEEPRQKGSTKKMLCKVTNRHGGSSTLQLDSLQYEEDVEARYKNKNYSGIYVSELSYYKNRKTFTCWMNALRGASYEPWHLMFLGDTNPADEGELSWIYKLWWDERLIESTDEGFKLWQEQLALMEFTVADNIFMDKDWHLRQKAAYQHSRDLMDREYYGKWIQSSGNSVFHQQLHPQVHFVGDNWAPTNPEPEIILPVDHCYSLITGWDAGLVNHAFHIIQKRFVKNGQREQSVFDVMDEVVDIKSERSFDQFVEECIERIDFWEKIAGQSLMWINWSDRSAFAIGTGTANVHQHQLIRQMSDNRIILQATGGSSGQSSGTVRQRVEMIQKLLFENRIYVCRSRCPYLIDSLQGLKKGKQGAAIDSHSPHKHAFDSASYAITSECWEEIIRPREDVNLGKAQPSNLTMVPM